MRKITVPLTFDDATDPDKLARVLLYAARRAAAVAEQSVSEYPPPRNAERPKTYKRFRLFNGKPTGQTYMSKWKNPQQQYFVHMLAQRGGIRYRRTGGLGQSITTDVYARADAVGFHIGTNKTDAQYVIGEKDNQAAYHQNWWTPLPENVRQHADAIKAEFIDAVKEGLK
jgi:hypothetical protein